MKSRMDHLSQTRSRSALFIYLLGYIDLSDLFYSSKCLVLPRLLLFVFYVQPSFVTHRRSGTATISRKEAKEDVLFEGGWTYRVYNSSGKISPHKHTAQTHQGFKDAFSWSPSCVRNRRELICGHNRWIYYAWISDGSNFNLCLYRCMNWGDAPAHNKMANYHLSTSKFPSHLQS